MMAVQNGSSVQIVSFRVGAKHYAVEIDRVIEIIYYMEPNPFPEAPPYIMGVIDLRGTIIPVLHLEAYLGISGEAPRGYILVVRAGSHVAGIMVDEVYDVMNVPQERIQDSESVLEKTSRHVKAVIRCSDHLLLLLNLEGFAESLPHAEGHSSRPHI